ncbi:hypothetical protein SAMN04488542_10794 [Fontibacillus panacisegetis]|uniref:RsgI N-terminal anti-sigma domain-containing protein n=2 Tax=Fontibacillus panacisegetis TaxID=670482 RepID=A0A1G7JBC8_9BACL|nr:hypothetical protein SAMN04488542_10794 [Fontibacillus panacisegetis]
MHGIVMKITEQCIVVLCEDGKFRNIPHLADMPKLGDRIPIVATADVDSIPVRKKYASRWFRQAWWLAASILLLIGAVFWWNPFTGNASTLVALDINPSMELYVKQDGRIEKIKPLNDDAKKLLSEREFIGQDIYEAVHIILGEAKKQGYLNADEGKNLIMLSTMDLSSTPFQLNKEKIDTAEEGYELEWFEADQSLKDKAEKAELSLNKYIVYEKAKEQGIELNIEELRAHSILSTLNGVGVEPQRLFTGAEDDIIEPKPQIDSSKEKQIKVKDGEQAGSGSGKEKDTQKQTTQKEKEKENQQQGQTTSQDKKQPSNITKNRGDSSQKQEPKEPAKEPAKNGATDGTKKGSSLNNKDNSEPGKGENRPDEGKKAKNNVSGENKPGNTNPDKNREESGHKGQ